MFFLVEPLKYIPELLPGFIMSVRRGRKGYDKPSQKVTRYMCSLVAKQTSISQSSVFHRLEIITLSRHNLYPSTCHLSCTVQCREGGRGEGENDHEKQ